MRRIDPCRPQTGAELSKRYRLRHPEACKAYQIAYMKNNPEKIRAIRLASHHRHPDRKLFNLAKARAKKHGLEFSLVLSDVVVPEFCPVLGIRLVVGGGTGFQDCSPTIDRLDNSRGYHPDNIAVISWRANRIKCDATLDELRALVRYLEDRQ